jgi:excisionase family DNA binding protein
MKIHPTQFDVRENTASPRRHDSRLATDVRSNSIYIGDQDPDTGICAPKIKSQTTDSETELHAAPQRAATGEKAGNQLLTIRDVAEMLQVPVSWVYGRMRKRSRERLPGYRLGKYWRFRTEEVLRWVQDHHEGFGEA